MSNCGKGYKGKGDLRTQRCDIWLGLRGLGSLHKKLTEIERWVGIDQAERAVGRNLRQRKEQAQRQWNEKVNVARAQGRRETEDKTIEAPNHTVSYRNLDFILMTFGSFWAFLNRGETWQGYSSKILLSALWRMGRVWTKMAVALSLEKHSTK